ncbi:porin family protein [Pontimicrobium aquaticum]|uniref:PorT family protein n=1 Tax=Pontimicrobium aquaticum TaxID=2565367 RepID=A0A4U0F3T5_9FLAO|nr:porin family protein [Pontimicrobium aquaticum]TJY37412.1 PorT family protein [Pontimicrobium aquaticum]
MKKQLFITALTIFGILTSYAQDNGDFELGLGLGLNLANVSTIDGQNNASSRISFNAGVSGEYYFSDRWGLKAKLIYDSKGWADGFITDENFNTVTTDFELNYATLPIMANWHFGSNRNWYLNFGPYVGFLMNAKDSELGMDVKEGFKSTDFGFAFGIGYKFEIDDSIKLFIEYDGQSGFSDVFEENSGDTIRNGRSSFNIGALFSL